MRLPSSLMRNTDEEHSAGLSLHPFYSYLKVKYIRGVESKQPHVLQLLPHYAHALLALLRRLAASDHQLA